MKKSLGVPDAWDDDYETVADVCISIRTAFPENIYKTQQQGPSISPPKTAEVKVTRAERKAQHAEANKQLWESAEKLETFHFVETRNNIPLKSEFKPQMKVLSRKPKPTTNINGSIQANGMVEHFDEDDSEEEARKAQLLSLAERQQKAQREREEKQRKYAEVRERLFGSQSHTDPDPNSGRSSPSRGGRTRATRGSRRGGADVMGRNSQSASSADHSPARTPGQGGKELYDPDYTSKVRPVFLQKRDPDSAVDLSQPIRHPRGPDGSGRGGFGFVTRGGKTNAT